MDPKQLAEKFAAKIAADATEKERQKGVAAENLQKRTDDVEHCKNALEKNVIPFFNELQHHLGQDQFSFAMQIDTDHRPVGVSFRIGDGPATSISTAFGNIIVTQTGASGSSKGVSHVCPPDAEPYISNSGDLTRDKMAKLVEMVMDNSLS
jgi:hypothetical protein